MAEQQQAAQQQQEECWFSGVEKIDQRLLASFYCSRKMASLVVGNGCHDTISPKKFTQKLTLCFEVPGLTFWKKPCFFSSLLGPSSVSWALDCCYFKIHQEVCCCFGSFQEFPWKFFPVLPVLSFDRTMEVLHCFNASWMWANVV